MTSEQTRAIVAQLVIAAAICGGLHAMLAGPLRGRALRAESDLQTFIDRHDMNASMLANLSQVVEQQRATADAAGRLTERNAPAQDESVMFTQVLDLAEAAGVTVEQFIPAGESKEAAKAAGAAAPRPGDRRVRYTLVGGGSYAGAAEFLELLQSDWANCALRQCRVTPDYKAGRDGAVRFSLLIELFSFDASPIALAPGTETTL